LYVLKASPSSSETAINGPATPEAGRYPLLCTKRNCLGTQGISEAEADRPSINLTTTAVRVESPGGLSPPGAMGERWLASADPRLHIPTDPARLATILAGFSTKFGPGFEQRAQEAVKCYNAQTYLACCAMCGAAAESILLAVAINRRGDAASVLRDYRAGGGRTRVERSLLGQVGEPVSLRFHMFMDLLNYWRDDSSLGVATTIDEPEAFDALSRLMRFAHFVNDQWAALTGKP
jgi:hypothetical protein